MEPYTVHRPDEAAIRRILEKHPYDAVGMAVRLAWMAGLLRNEIVSVRWDAVNFLNQEIELPDRSIPLCPELEEYLARMSERLDWGSNYVLLSDRLHKPMQPQPVSHIVRRDRGRSVSSICGTISSSVSCSGMTGSMSPASPASRLWRWGSTLRSFCPKSGCPQRFCRRERRTSMKFSSPGSCTARGPRRRELPCSLPGRLG